MGKLATAMRMHRTGARQLLLPSLSVKESKEDGCFGDEYILAATFSQRCIVWPHADLKQVMDRCREAVLEEVFGEFRHLLIQLEKAAYCGDHQETVALARELRRSMFSTD